MDLSALIKSNRRVRDLEERLEIVQRERDQSLQYNKVLLKAIDDAGVSAAIEASIKRQIDMENTERFFRGFADNLYDRYEAAGAPYGYDWLGLEKWLREQPHGSIGPVIQVWMLTKAQFPESMLLEGYPQDRIPSDA